jgi:hypothetical protein
MIYVKARFSTTNKRDQALAQITNYTARPGISADYFVPAQVASLDAAYKGWGNALTAELRFRTQSNRDDLWTQMDAFLSTSARAPVESLGEKWDSQLDAPDPDADTTRYNYLVKNWA